MFHRRVSTGARNLPPMLASAPPKDCAVRALRYTPTKRRGTQGERVEWQRPHPKMRMPALYEPRRSHGRRGVRQGATPLPHGAVVVPARELLSAAFLEPAGVA